MPSLSETLRPTVPAGYTITDKMQTPPQAPAYTSLEPTRNTMQRGAMPPIWSTNIDSYRNFYRGGQVPQTRVYSQPYNK